jgi:hypothetical protein
MVARRSAAPVNRPSEASPLLAVCSEAPTFGWSTGESLGSSRSAHLPRVSDARDQSSLLQQAHGASLIGIDHDGVLRLATNDE